MKPVYYLKILSIFSLLFFAFISVTFSQSNSVAMSHADTSRFSTNSDGGWQLYNSYVSNNGQDSATLELAIQHANNIDWTAEQLVGQIYYQPLIPATRQNVPFLFANNNYMMRIDSKGNCYVRLADGALPTDDPFVILLKIFYKL